MAFSSNFTLAIPDLTAIRRSATNQRDTAVTAAFHSSFSSKSKASAASVYPTLKSSVKEDRKLKYSLNTYGKRWWEKSVVPNMLEIRSAQNLVELLLNAGDKLVIVDFYSPGCGGCRALHPKICQLAESNPEAVFLKVNYDELKKLCHLLHIHVLPFFKFYRGAEGCLCSFSCTNATIKKFKDALAKHSTNRCSLGAAKGLDESELLSLASSGEMVTGLPCRGGVEELLMHSLCRSGSSLDKANPSMTVHEERELVGV